MEQIGVATGLIRDYVITFLSVGRKLSLRGMSRLLDPGHHRIKVKGVNATSHIVTRTHNYQQYQGGRAGGRTDRQREIMIKCNQSWFAFTMPLIAT